MIDLYYRILLQLYLIDVIVSRTIIIITNAFYALTPLIY